MENTSKALLIAGGVLLAIMVVSLLVLGYNRLSDYQQSKNLAMTKEQIEAFNKEYEAYHRNDVTGFELVGLINKVLSYNKLNTISTEENDWGNSSSDIAYTEMYLKFTINNNDIKQLYSYNGGVYDTQKKAAKTNSNKDGLEDIMIRMQELERKYGSSTMSKLAQMTDYDKDTEDGINAIKDKLVIKRNRPLSPENLPEKEDVEVYQCYVEFKRANFNCVDTEYDTKSGRITKLIFEQV